MVGGLDGGHSGRGNSKGLSLVTCSLGKLCAPPNQPPPCLLMQRKKGHLSINWLLTTYGWVNGNQYIDSLERAQETNMCSRHNILLFEADHRCLTSVSVVSVQPELNSDVVKALGIFLDSLKSKNYNWKT